MTKDINQINYTKGDETGTKRANSASGWVLPAESEKTPVISVVLPTLNEEAGIAECIDRIKNALDEIGEPGEIVVSDSSTDRTPDIARENGAIVVEPDRGGYGYAYRYALEQARGEYLVIGDADTTYDFEELPKLLEPVWNGEADLCMGSRLEGEIKPGAMPPLHQYVGNPLLTKFLNMFYDADVSDAHSGFRVLTQEAYETLNLRTNGMEFASEMVMQAGANDLRIAEVPITYHEREGEATLDSFRDGWRHVKFMLQNAPGYLFTGPAIGFGLVGMVLMGLSLLDHTVGPIYFGVHTVIIGNLLTILGYQVGSLSIFSSVATNPIREPQDPITTFVKTRFRLEHGATLGLCGSCLAMLAAGWIGWIWVTGRIPSTQLVVPLMIVSTAIILGIQTVFYSFFLSMLGGQRL